MYRRPTRRIVVPAVVFAAVISSLASAQIRGNIRGEATLPVEVNGKLTDAHAILSGDEAYVPLSALGKIFGAQSVSARLLDGAGQEKAVTIEYTQPSRGAPPAAQEEVLPLDEFPPIADRSGYCRAGEQTMIGGVLWDNPLEIGPGGLGSGMGGGMMGGAMMGGGMMGGAIWQIGGKWDLFECYVGIDDQRGSDSATFTFYADDERVGRAAVRRGDKAHFFWCRVAGASVFKIMYQITGNWDRLPLLLDGRFVRGRTQPRKAMDLWVRHGETQYIERPGDYTFHVR